MFKIMLLVLVTILLSNCGIVSDELKKDVIVEDITRVDKNNTPKETVIKSKSKKIVVVNTEESIIVDDEASFRSENLNGSSNFFDSFNTKNNGRVDNDVIVDNSDAKTKNNVDSYKGKQNTGVASGDAGVSNAAVTTNDKKVANDVTVYDDYNDGSLDVSSGLLVDASDDSDSNYYVTSNSDIKSIAFEDFEKSGVKFVLYFSYDDFDIGEFEIKEVIKHANFMSDNKNFKLRLEGHADERGTREYNLALGENRALSIKEILGLYDLSYRVSVISYGEEVPVSQVNNDIGWQKNRRVEFIYEQ